MVLYGILGLYSDIGSFGSADKIGTFGDYKDVVQAFNGNNVKIYTYSSENLEVLL